MKYKINDEVRILVDTGRFKKGSIWAITDIDIIESNYPYRIEGINKWGDPDWDWYTENQIELVSSSYKTPIDWPVPDWFTWGYKHECYVSDISEEDALKQKEKRTVYAIEPKALPYLFRTYDGNIGFNCYKYAVPVPQEEPFIIDTILEDTDFGCRKEDVKKVLQRLHDHLKGDKE